MSNFLHYDVTNEIVFAHFSSDPTEEDVHEAIMACHSILKHVPSEIKETEKKHVWMIGDTKNKTAFSGVSFMRYDNHGFDVANFGEKCFMEYVDFDSGSKEDLEKEIEDEHYDEYDFLCAMRHKKAGLIGHNSGKYFYWPLDDDEQSVKLVILVIGNVGAGHRTTMADRSSDGSVI